MSPDTQKLASPVPGRSRGAEGRGAPAARPHDLPAPIRSVLRRISVGDDVRPAELGAACDAIRDLPAPTRDVVFGSILTAVTVRGPVADEVEALLRSALAMDARAAQEHVGGEGPHPVLLLAGSGKKGFRTPNISTPAALVAAAVGARVIKVGSAATSSALGSRDLVRALGLREARTADEVRADMAARRFAFVAVEPEIPALDSVYGGRFHAPNPFSFGLAPLASPVRGDVTVFGLAHPRVDVAAEVLRRFGMGEVEVVSTRLPSGHYLDEIGLAGDLHACAVRGGAAGPVEVRALGTEVAVGAVEAAPAAPCGPAEAADRTAELLAGGGLEGHRALVAVNSAFLLVRAGLADTLVEGRELAEDALRSGSVLKSEAFAATGGV